MSKKWLWWLITISIFFFIFIFVSYGILFCLNIEENNKWNTFFSFVSSLSIVVAFVTYFLQKKERIEKEKRENNAILKILFEKVSVEYREAIDRLDDFIDKTKTIYSIESNVSYSLESNRNYLISLIANKIKKEDEIKIYQPRLRERTGIDISLFELAKQNISLLDTLLEMEYMIGVIRYHIDTLIEMNSQCRIKSTPPVLIVAELISIEKLRNSMNDIIKEYY
ncbi:hypothetical protein CEP63_018575 [Proteus mirabilis]|uniref:hypothetical protein n=1 Tax=Proteus terrae TaxID=1574161 RepID=UPI000C9DDAC7|nr:hypothetical protein CEP63_018575 [Proteus mirabilis]